VSFDHSVGDSNCLVPPFLLFPLVENAFKHGTVNLIKPTNISIHLSVNEDKLHLQVENEVMTAKAEEGGIGLSALKKKLGYYYDGDYILEAGVADNRYIAQLEISRICKK
jgi:LytS/YehU family sensor histidine kinase